MLIECLLKTLGNMLGLGNYTTKNKQVNHTGLSTLQQSCQVTRKVTLETGLGFSWNKTSQSNEFVLVPGS